MKKENAGDKAGVLNIKIPMPHERTHVERLVDDFFVQEQFTARISAAVFNEKSAQGASVSSVVWGRAACLLREAISRDRHDAMLLHLNPGAELAAKVKEIAALQDRVKELQQFLSPKLSEKKGGTK